MTYLEKAKAFQQMLQDKGSFATFEHYYADNCEITEMPTSVVRKGKDAQRDAIKEWFSNVEQFNAAGVDAITSNEDAGTTMIESWMDITYKNGHRGNNERSRCAKVGWRQNYFREVLLQPSRISY